VDYSKQEEILASCNVFITHQLLSLDDISTRYELEPKLSEIYTPYFSAYTVTINMESFSNSKIFCEETLLENFF